MDMSLLFKSTPNDLAMSSTLLICGDGILPSVLFFIGVNVDISTPDPITSIGCDLKCACALNVSAFGKSLANTFLTTVMAVVCF